ncbi:hypothetical protein [Aureispira anguillae]|nr:hypothetical protein [Aureispira anguillae]
MDSETYNFTEGTVGMVGEHKVMFSNIMIQDYTLEDGTAKEGPAASLSLPNSKEWLTVGAGCTFELDGVRYEIVQVLEGTPFGSVEIQVYSEIYDFTEGTVGMIGKHKVMFSNIMIQDYTLEDGTKKEGPAASLSLPNNKEWFTAGTGYAFVLDGGKYEVVEVLEGSPFGSVKVKMISN